MSEKRLKCPKCGTVSPVSAGKCLGCGLAMVKKKRPPKQTAPMESSPHQPQTKQASPAQKSAPSKPAPKPAPQTKPKPQAKPQKAPTQVKPIESKQQRPVQPGKSGPATRKTITPSGPKKPIKKRPPQKQSWLERTSFDDDVSSAASSAGINNNAIFETTAIKDLDDPKEETTDIRFERSDHTGLDKANQTKTAIIGNISRTGEENILKEDVQVEQSSLVEQHRFEETGDIDESGSMLSMMQDVSENDTPFQYVQEKAENVVPKGQTPAQDRRQKPWPPKDGQLPPNDRRQFDRMHGVRAPKQSQAVEGAGPKPPRPKWRTALVWVLPQIFILLAVIFAGPIVVDTMLFDGSWKGYVINDAQVSIPFEIKLKRMGNSVTGTAVFENQSKNQENGERKPLEDVVFQSLASDRPVVEGSFDKHNINMMIYNPATKATATLTFNGEFKSFFLVEGDMENEYTDMNHFVLERRF